MPNKRRKVLKVRRVPIKDVSSTGRLRLNGSDQPTDSAISEMQRKYLASTRRLPAPIERAIPYAIQKRVPIAKQGGKSNIRNIAFGLLAVGFTAYQIANLVKNSSLSTGFFSAAKEYPDKYQPFANFSSSQLKEISSSLGNHDIQMESLAEILATPVEEISAQGVLDKFNFDKVGQRDKNLIDRALFKDYYNPGDETTRGDSWGSFFTKLFKAKEIDITEGLIENADGTYTDPNAFKKLFDQNSYEVNGINKFKNALDNPRPNPYQEFLPNGDVIYDAFSFAKDDRTRAQLLEEFLPQGDIFAPAFDKYAPYDQVARYLEDQYSLTSTESGLLDWVSISLDSTGSSINSSIHEKLGSGWGSDLLGGIVEGSANLLGGAVELTGGVVDGLLGTNLTEGPVSNVGEVVGGVAGFAGALYSGLSNAGALYKLGAGFF